jgi:hypothetical protein
MVDFPNNTAGQFTFNGVTYDATTWLTYFDNNVNTDPFIKTQFTNLLYQSGLFDTGGNLFSGAGREVWNQVGIWAASQGKAGKPYKLGTTQDAKNITRGITYAATNDSALANFGGYLKSSGNDKPDDNTGERMSKKDIIINLRQFAFDNGIVISEKDLNTRANSIVGLGANNTTLVKPTDTLENVKQFYRTKVIAPKYTQFADDIKGGTDVRDLANDYIAMISNELEIDPEKIDLAKDPLLGKALLGYAGKGGKKTYPNYTDFQTMVRQDKRWWNTNNAKDSISTTANSIKRMFGF